MSKSILSWRVVIGDVARHRAMDTFVVVAPDASTAEIRALELKGPMNDGNNYVYRFQATSITLIAVAQ